MIIDDNWYLINDNNGCGMLTDDAYSSGHLVLSHFGTCKFSNVETNLSWTCLVSGLLSFKQHSVPLCFAFISEMGIWLKIRMPVPGNIVNKWVLHNNVILISHFVIIAVE